MCVYIYIYTCPIRTFICIIRCCPLPDPPPS